MSLPKFNPRTAVLVFFIVITGALRVLAATGKHVYPLSNFTPLAAMALFGGAYFSSNLKAYGWPLFTLWISDILMNRFVFFGEWQLLYEGFYWTYGAFALMTLAGRLLIKKTSIRPILSAALVSVLIHWTVTDFGVWLDSSLYAKTITGFIQCLVAAIPFEIRLMEGTLLYGAILFGAFEWMQRRYSVLAIVK